MPDANDMDLMREYADRNSETAFAGLVHRHINLVYSVALRFTGNSPDAQDVTQAVFIILAQKAASLRQRTTLTGWLYETTRFTARQLLRTRARQQAREQEVYMQSTLNDPNSENVWRQLAPLLEEAMARLSEKERTLVALRFFENKSAAETAALLGIREWAAHKRVARAMEKLRQFFVKRGIASTTATLAGAISANSVQAAPAMLAKAVTATAIAKGVTASASTLTLIKGALKIMAWTKIKTAIVVGVGILLVAGTATVTVKKIREHTTDELWRIPNLDSTIVDRLPPEVKILPSKFPMEVEHTAGGSRGKIAGVGIPISWILADAYGVTPQRMLFADGVAPDIHAPQARYDFICTLPQHPREALQQEVKKQFGLVGRREMRETDVLLLTVKYPNALGLKPDRNPRGISWNHGGIGYYSCTNVALADGLASEFLEFYFNTPIIDQTGLKQHFDIDLTWDEPDGQSQTYDAWQHRNLDGVKQALLDQLGLELISTNMPVEMLVVEKVN